MKLYQKILSVGLLVGVLGWASSSAAAPIPYSFTLYTAHAETFSNVSEMSFIDPPVIAGSVDFSALIPAQAIAEAPDNSHFSASSTSHGGSPASSFVQATFQFTSTFPAIKIQYDFNITAVAALDTLGEPFISGSAEAEMNSFLRDTTTGLKIWSDDQIVTASVIGPGPPFSDGRSDSGSIDEILALTLGHEYELFLSCSSEAIGMSGAVGNLLTEGLGSAELTNILVDAVPIPSTLLLLSTGLIGLLEFRRRLKG